MPSNVWPVSGESGVKVVALTAGSRELWYIAHFPPPRAILSFFFPDLCRLIAAVNAPQFFLFFLYLKPWDILCHIFRLPHNSVNLSIGVAACYVDTKVKPNTLPRFLWCTFSAPQEIRIVVWGCAGRLQTWRWFLSTARGAKHNQNCSI